MADRPASPTAPRRPRFGPKRRETVRLSLAWPPDPFFRPTVGVFGAGRLLAVLPTVRVPPTDARDPVWPCALATPPDDLPPGPLHWRCLETGEPARTGEAVPPAGSLDALLAPTGAALPPTARAGFPAFLSLPERDQLSLLAHAILGRALDEEALGDHMAALALGTTILDIRDVMLAGPDFAERRAAGVAPPFGHWLVWSGLAGARGCLAVWETPPAWVEPSDMWRRRLARTALGPRAAPAVVELWLAAHAEAVDRLESARPAPAPAGASPHPGTLRLDQLMDAMRVGPAGRREAGGAVRIRTEEAGDVLFGPYAALAPGHYRLTLRIGWDLRTTPGGPGPLALEVVHGDMLLAATAVASDPGAPEHATLAFTVPASQPGLQAARLEYRLHSPGGVGGVVSDLVLHRLDAPEPARFDLLPLLSVGTAGQRRGGSVSAAAGSRGHVVHGPYRALLPGRYTVTVTLGDAPPAGLGRLGIVADVVARGGRRLARRRLSVSGPARITMGLTVPPGLGAPLEVRLYKWPGTAFTVSGVQVTPVTQF